MFGFITYVTWILLTIIGVILLYFWRKWLKVKQFWKEAGVSFTEPHPIYGSLGFCYTKNIIEWLTIQYRLHKGKPYFGIWLFWRPCLVIRSPEIAGRVLVKDFNSFRDRLVGSGKDDPIGGLNIFTLNDPLWSSIRKKLTPVFTSAKLRSLQNLKLTKSKQLVQRIRNERELGRKFVLRNVFADYTTDVIGASAFGVDGDATLTGESPMRDVTKEFMRYSLSRTFGLFFIFFFPEVADFFKFTLFPSSTIEYFRKVYAQVAKSRGEWNQEREVHDLLDALLKIKWEAGQNGEDMPDDVLIAQAVIFLQAGFDTTAVVMSYLFLEIAFRPEIQEKMYKELCEAKQKQDGKDLNTDVLKQLPYLNAVIKETLRKYTAMGWLDRVASTDYKIDENLTIKKGTVVYVCATGMAYDEEYYSDPNGFNPDRFLPENEKDIKPYTYLPFGDGPRNCIGVRFGRQTMWYAISQILLEFKAVPYPDTPRPENVKPDVLSIFLGPDKLLHLNFIPRNR